MKTTVRFEVIDGKRYNLLGYVYGRDIDHAYDQAALRYKGADVVIVTGKQEVAA